MGDLNGRVANMYDFIQDDECKWFAPEYSTKVKFDSSTPRSTLDTSTNEQGKRVTDLCRSIGLSILNGRKL